MQALKDFFKGAWSLVAGLSVTFRYMFKRPVTVQYPYEELPMSDAYRGHIQLINNDDGAHTCVACLVCVNLCPSGCITVTGEKDPETRKKFPTSFLVRFDYCSLCGLCVESCNTTALEYSKAYDEVSEQRADLTYDLLASFPKRETAKPKEEPDSDESKEPKEDG